MLVTINYLDEWGVDIIGLPETNSSWLNKYEQDRWKLVIKTKGPEAVILAESKPDNNTNVNYKPGGLSMVIRSRYESQV